MVFGVCVCVGLRLRLEGGMGLEGGVWMRGLVLGKCVYFFFLFILEVDGFAWYHDYAFCLFLAFFSIFCFAFIVSFCFSPSSLSLLFSEL